jgi:hypothetical protein
MRLSPRPTHHLWVRSVRVQISVLLIALLFAVGPSSRSSSMARLTGAGWSEAVASPVQANNGQRPRPFWSVTHNPNEAHEATEALSAGANALGPDLMYFNCPNRMILVNGVLTASPLVGFYMYHDDTCVPTRTPISLTAYLDHLHNLAKGGANLALLALDIKSPAANRLKGNSRDPRGNAFELLDLVATRLNHDGVNVNVIYSVATRTDSNNFFDYMCLKPREGIMIDQENGPADVINHLIGQINTANMRCGGNVPYNMAFGNGSFGESFGFAPNVILSIDQASWIRAGQPGHFAVLYAYPIVASRMNEYITAGADGLIPDEDFQPQIWALTLGQIAALKNVVLGRPDVYMATKNDNPFRPRKEAYGLRVTTRDVSLAGTDADLTFKLTGSCGSAEVTIDASYASGIAIPNRFEQDRVDYVTLPSKNLGFLQKIELKSDSTGANPDWEPGSIQISSDRWGIPYAMNRTVDFTGEVVSSSDPAERTIAGWGRQCDSIPPTAAPTQAPAKNAAGWNNTDVTVSWNWTDNAGGSGVDADSCTNTSVSTGVGSAIMLTATCSDIDGNTATASYTVRVDKAPPTGITITGFSGLTPLGGTVSAMDALSGVATPSCTDTVANGVTQGMITLTGSPASGSRPLMLVGQGTHTLSCTATDAAGNTSSPPVTRTVMVGPGEFKLGVVPGAPMPAPASITSPLTWEFALINPGADTLTGVTVTFTLPSSLQRVSVQVLGPTLQPVPVMNGVPMCNSSAANQRESCSIGTLPPGGAVVFRLVERVVRISTFVPLCITAQVQGTVPSRPGLVQAEICLPIKQ